MNNLKRVFYFFISLVLVICTNSKSFVLADDISELTEDEKEVAINVISESISNIEQQTCTATDINVLYDINNNPTYILAELEPYGYAIFTREKLWLSEYAVGINSPYEGESGEYKLYYGPHNYGSCNSFDIPRRSPSMYAENNEANQMIIDANERMLESDGEIGIDYRRAPAGAGKGKPSEEPKHTPEEYNVSWLGVSEERMSLYNWGHYPTYTNNHSNPNGICGTVAATIMLAYSDDRIDNKIVPTIIRPQFIKTPGRLCEVMWYAIDFPHQNGTYPVDLVSGINSFFNTYEQHFEKHGYTAKSNLLNIGASQHIMQNNVLCLGLISALGSEYGDHWVAGYAISDNFKYYKCIDTWVGYTDPDDGSYPFLESNNYRAVVNANWVASTVGLYK